MKVKAFSFLEVMVGMVLSGMVISTVYSVYMYSHKNLFKFAEVQSNLRSFHEFSSVLNSDFEQAKKVVKINAEEIEIKTNDKIIRYEFQEEYTVRSLNQHMDTFFISTTVFNLNVVNELSKEPLIDYIELTINNSPMSYYKNYGAVIKLEE